jgi:hypothetical protein
MDYDGFLGVCESSLDAFNQMLLGKIFHVARAGGPNKRMKGLAARLAERYWSKTTCFEKHID